MRRSLLLGGLSWVWPARAQQGIAPAVLDYAAGTLAHLIEAGRERAIADGVRPIPTPVYRGLLGFFPPSLLHRVRFASGRGKGKLTLPSLAFSYGDVVAMTLVDVILFREEKVAQSDLKLWAHELTHVMQYQRWGIEHFAHEYVRNRDQVEQEARDQAARFVNWQASGGSPDL